MGVCVCGAAIPDAARFCPQCGLPTDDLQSSAHERKLITTVFIDLVGSPTATRAIDPEDVAARLRPYYDCVRSELERNGGTVEKFVGDAVVAIFGAPVAHEDDPERAIRAALAAFDQIAELNAKDAWLDLKIGVGINTGEALVDLGARTAFGEGVASGDVMNTAARLQAAAPVNGILVGELTHRATHDRVEYRHAGLIAAKGKSKPVAAWEVIGMRQRIANPSRGAFVGREAELRELLALWGTTRQRRQPAAAIVMGSPGLGKSRLLEELAASVSPDGRVLRGRCLPYGEGIAYWAIAEIIEQAAGVLKSDAAATAETKLVATLDRLDVQDPDERRTLMAAAANVLGIVVKDASGQLSRAELHWGLRRLLHMLSLDHVLLLVVEDLQWADPSLIDFLRYVVEGESGAYLLAASCRSDASDSVRAFVENTGLSIELRPLDAAASHVLLTELVGSEDADSDMASQILGKAGGNPFFIEELVRMIRETGRGWDIEGERDESFPLPATLQTLIDARLDRLDGTAKRIAQYASVVGESFWPSAVAQLLGDDTDVEAGLEMLERGDFVYSKSTTTLEGEAEYAFKHILVRDVAYAQLTKAARMELHARLAEWVQALEKQDLIEVIAWHLEHACKLGHELGRTTIEPPVDEAVIALSRAAERAKTHEGWREAERFFARAIDISGGEAEAALELRLRHAGALLGIGKLDQGLRLVAAAKAAALEGDRLELAADAVMMLCQTAHRQGWAHEARSHLFELQQLAQELGDSRLLLRVQFVGAAVKADLDAALEDALDDLAGAVESAEAIGDTTLLIEGHLRMGFILFNMGRLADAEAELRHCTLLAAAAGDTRDQARASYLLAFIEYLRGHLEDAERQAVEAKARLERTGETFFQIQNLGALGECALGRGDAAAAEQRLREALAIALDEDSFLVAEVSRLLIDALVELNRLGDAAELRAFVARRVQQDHPYARAAVDRAEAVLADATGDWPTALDRHQAAIAQLDALGMPIDLAQARVSYAKTLTKLGDLSEAQEQLQRARQGFEATGASGLLVRVERELDQMVGHD